LYCSGQARALAAAERRVWNNAAQTTRPLSGGQCVVSSDQAQAHIGIFNELLQSTRTIVVRQLSFLSQFPEHDMCFCLWIFLDSLGFC
jgi:hypothetical protein